MCTAHMLAEKAAAGMKPEKLGVYVNSGGSRRVYRNGPIVLKIQSLHNGSNENEIHLWGTHEACRPHLAPIYAHSDDQRVIVAKYIPNDCVMYNTPGYKLASDQMVALRKMISVADVSIPDYAGNSVWDKENQRVIIRDYGFCTPAK